MSNSNETGFWAEFGKLAKKIPAPSVLFVTSYFLYKSSNNWPATITLFTGLLLCIVHVFNELYKGSIKSLKSDVTYYSKMAKDANTQSFKSISESSERLMDMQTKYVRPKDTSTTTSE